MNPELKSYLTFRLARLQSRLNAQAIRLLRWNSDLSLTEWRILSVTARNEIATLSRLVEETALDKGQLSRGVSSLIRKGYMSSKTNEYDHRQHDLSLTPRGKELHAKILPIMRSRQKSLTEDLTEQDLDVLWTVIDKLERASEG